MDDFMKEVVRLVKERGKSWTELGEILDENPERIRSAWRRYEGTHTKDSSPIKDRDWTEEYDTEGEAQGEKHQVNFDIDGFKATASSESTRIRTLEQLLDACEVDLSLWKVDRHIVNKWEIARRAEERDLTFSGGRIDGYVTDSGLMNVQDLYQVKAWLSPREEYSLEKSVENIVSRLSTYTPNYNPPAPFFSSGEYLYVPCIYDAHIGKRSYDNKWTLEKASEDFLKAAEALAGMAMSSGRKVGKILFVVGHDIMHVDTMKETTAQGTWVEAAGGAIDIIDAVAETVPQAVERFATVAPVDVIPVSDNHSPMQTRWLMHLLNNRFLDHPHVNVITKKAERQYYEWNNVGFQLTHKPAKVQDLMSAFSVEARQLWGRITWAEILLGHIHKERGALYMVDSYRGARARTIPALCETDAYHQLHLYVGQHRAAEGLWYHEKNGPGGDWPVFVDEI